MDRTRYRPPRRSIHHVAVIARRLIQIHIARLFPQLLHTPGLLDHPPDLAVCLLPDVQLEVGRHGGDVISVFLDEAVKPRLLRNRGVAFDGGGGSSKGFERWD